MQTEVLIVGAGPTGLALALWLARLGVGVRIVDRAPSPGMAARAFALQARTLELYDRLGLARDALSRGRAVPALTVHARGRSRSIPLGAIGKGLSPFPFVLMLLQDDHEKLLIDHLADAGVEVERNVELVDLDVSSVPVRARLKGESGADEVCEATYVCGCDGAGSIVRQLLGIEFPGRSSEEMVYVADVQARGPLADGGVHYVMSGDHVCSVFAKRSPARLRLIGLAPRAVRQPAAQVSFEDIAPQIEQDTGLAISLVESFAVYSVNQRTAPVWRKGAVFLLGDAAHTHSPFGGQGLNAGVGDAVNLAWKLGAVLRGGAEDSLLDTYQDERRAAAQQVAATTDRGFAVQTERSRLMALARAMLLTSAQGMMRSAAVGRWVFGVVSQTGVHYRRSLAGSGRAGRIGGGDRLPWVEMDDGTSNFAALQPPFPLETPKPEPLEDEAGDDDLAEFGGAYRFTERALGFGWQAQIYGEARDALREACDEWGLDLKTFAWSPQAHRAGLVRDAVYLVRPDGYVGFASRRQTVHGIASYLQRFEIRFRSAPGTGGVLHAGLGAPQVHP
jgi:2-polyprenyl-6-methoxyphenol hydroxylase-like FAD-dependent oxidoreductase